MVTREWAEDRLAKVNDLIGMAGELAPRHAALEVEGMVLGAFLALDDAARIVCEDLEREVLHAGESRYREWAEALRAALLPRGGEGGDRG